MKIPDKVTNYIYSNISNNIFNLKIFRLPAGIVSSCANYPINHKH